MMNIKVQLKKVMFIKIKIKIILKFGILLIFILVIFSLNQKIGNNILLC